jgi:hypothetical protein
MRNDRKVVRTISPIWISSQHFIRGTTVRGKCVSLVSGELGRDVRGSSETNDMLCNQTPQALASEKVRVGWEDACIRSCVQYPVHVQKK